LISDISPAGVSRSAASQSNGLVIFEMLPRQRKLGLQRSCSH
jgi:hypothetical protein